MDGRKPGDAANAGNAGNVDGRKPGNGQRRHPQDGLAERFEAHRGGLRAVAYRMLGSLSEADDAVQETWLRLSRADAEAVGNLTGWLRTVVSRICLDMLRSRTARREEPVGQELPETARETGDGGGGGGGPEDEAVLADSVGRALLFTFCPPTANPRRAKTDVRHCDWDVCSGCRKASGSACG
ncbi:sigma factor, partial [Streptomyces asiaticus]